MAVWQFDLELVPRERVAQYLNSGNDALDEATRDRATWWEGRTLPPGYLTLLETFAPWSMPWGPDWKIFGTEHGNRVDIMESNGQIEEVRARIDVRDLDPDFIRPLLAFASTCNCVFLTPSGRVVEPDLDAVLVELELSPAADYIRDPHGFLSQLKRRHRGR